MLDMEHRIERLEETLALQDRMMEQLNQVVIEQQRQIDQLTRQITLLADRVKGLNLEENGGAGDEPPPPHYNGPL